MFSRLNLRAEERSLFRLAPTESNGILGTNFHNETERPDEVLATEI